MLGGNLEGHTFLDLYAGAGTVGLEAVSRGAERAIFIEQDRQALGTLARNIRSLHCEDQCEVIEASVASVSGDVYRRATLIFMDPPYFAQPSLPLLRKYLESAPRPPLVIYQRDSRVGHPLGRGVPPAWIPDKMPLLEERHYGRTMFSLYYQEAE